MRHGARPLADQFVWLVAEELARGRRHVSAAEIAIELEDHIGCVVGKQAQLGFAVTQVLLPQRDGLGHAVQGRAEHAEFRGLPGLHDGARRQIAIAEHLRRIDEMTDRPQ
jgi:hypothetical protein